MFYKLFLIGVVLETSNAVIYQLNDTEYARMPPLYAMDPYQPCIEKGGVYCDANLRLYSDEPNELYTMMKEYSKHTVKHYDYFNIDRAICLTTSCKEYLHQHKQLDNKGLSDTLEVCLNDSIWKQYKLMAKLNKLFHCDKSSPEIEKDALDWFMAGIFGSIVIVNIFGSFYDILHDRIKLKTAVNFGQYLMCFSIIRNTKQLFSKKNTDPRFRSIHGFHGIKTLVMFCVIYSHAIFLIASGYTADPHTYEKAYEHPFHRLHFGGLVLVQIFFVLSGFLLTYLLQIRSEEYNISWSSVPKIIFLRWLRLTTTYALLVGFLATWMRHLGSGPLWDRNVVNAPVAECRQYWWSHLVFINNYIPNNKFCAYQTWHVACDMQLFILGVIAYFATRNGGRKLVFGLLILLGMLFPALHVWFEDMDGITILKPEFYRTLEDATFRYVRCRGHNHIVGFAIGMSTAIVAYNLQKKQIDYSNNKILKILSWCCIPALIGVLASGKIFLEDDDRASVATRMLYALTQRASVGIIAAFGILTMICKCNHMAQTLFPWHGWVVASRLTYIVNLIHPVFLHWLMGIRTEPHYVSYLYVAKILVGVAIASYTLAIPLYIMVEAPTYKLIHLSSRQQHKKTE